MRPWSSGLRWPELTYRRIFKNVSRLDYLHPLNLTGLFFLGPRLEARLGARGFLSLCFLSGLSGAAFSFVLSFGSPVVGASAAERLFLDRMSEE